MSSDTVTPLRVGQGSFLASVSLFRMPNGTVRAVLDEMPAHVIEERDTITARFMAAGEWCLEGGLDLMRQAVRFDEETRRSMEDPSHVQ